MSPSTADLRRFLVDAFSDEELKALCFDYFRDVHDDFTTGMSKTRMIQITIERCVRRDALANLEAALIAERPEQYVKRFGAPAPPTGPVEPAPAEASAAGRDPRQVFISHAHEDAAFAHQLAADLAAAGWRAWIAPESIQPGEKWVEAIGRGLDDSGVFVVALTPAAVGSSWVKNETNAAIELDNRGEVQFIPLDVQASTVPVLWNVYQRIPFRGRYEDGLSALLNRLGGTPAVASVIQAPEVVQPTASIISAPVVVSRRGPIDFDWVTIPAGKFLMGSDKKKDKQAFDNETPQYTLHLPEYHIARVPVMVAQFAAFMAANQGYHTTAEEQGSAWSYTGWKWEQVKGADWAHPRGLKSDVRAKQDHPVTCVSWHDAVAFCKWAGVWLPTEAEWEKAARGTDGRIWPWGNRKPDSELCNFNMTAADTMPVGCYPDGKSPYGLLDVAGNVWEWTSSLLKSYKYDSQDGRENPKSSGARVLRGGSFGIDARLVRCACRDWSHPINRYDHNGFRVVSPGS